MNTDCNDLINSYIEWLKQKIKIEHIKDICEVTTPFLDRHNDHLQIYIKKNKDRIVLTDDGYILQDLKVSGFEITTEKRETLLQSILNGFGARLEGNEIIIETSLENFPQRKHNMIQAMLAVNDLFVMSPEIVAGVFREDVESYLKTNNIRYIPSVKFTGKSRYDQVFDFVIPHSNRHPERIIKAINNPTRQNITLLIFAWLDIRDVRPIKSTVYGFLNDKEQEVNPDTINALKQYEINCVVWSKREEYTKQLLD